MAPGLCYDQSLSDFGYALNKEAKVVVCIGCHRGVPLGMLQTHTRNHHKGRSLLPSEEHNRVTQSLSELGYRTSQGEKYHQPPGQKPVDGLEVQNGFACPLPNHDGTRCSRVFLGDKTFARHLSEHPGRPKPSLPSCASEVQTLFSQGGLQLYFSVDSSLSDLDPSADSAYAYAVKILPQLPKPRTPTSKNDKDRASIHWFTRWPELLQPYLPDEDSVEALKSLVSFPDSDSDPDWLVKLQDYGCRWWNDAELAHVNCSFRASVMLKSHQKCVFSVAADSGFKPFVV